MTKLLIVEDNSHKLDRLRTFIHETFPRVEIAESHSFTSACQKLESTTFDVVIMDMSLPTYDRSHTDSGGRFRTFGGREIARKMTRRKLKSLVIFVTQYDSFSDKVRSHTLESLSTELREECGDCYGGLFLYDSSQSAWKERMTDAITEALS